MASALIDELKTLATEVERSDMEDVVVTSRTALAAGEDPQCERIMDSTGRSGGNRNGGAARSRERTMGRRWGEGTRRPMETERESSGIPARQGERAEPDQPKLSKHVYRSYAPGTI